MTTTWTIETKVLPVALIGAHLYIEIWDENGNRVTQINGFATDPTTGQIHTVGQDGDVIDTYIGTPILSDTVGATEFNHPHQGLAIFSGSPVDVMRAIDFAKVAAAYLNAQALPYQVLPSDGFYNSNSVFNTILGVMQQALPPGTYANGEDGITDQEIAAAIRFQSRRKPSEAEIAALLDISSPRLPRLRATSEQEQF